MPGPSKDLRQRAEQYIQDMERTTPMAARDLQGVLHELDVHTVELELQNEELMATQAELQQAHDRYFELYDLAPIGYITLDAGGRIRRSNFVAAQLLGIERSRLQGRALTSFLEPRELPRFRDFLAAALQATAEASCTMETVIPRRSDTLHVRLESSGVQSQGGMCRVALVDITARWRAEHALREREAQLATLLATVADGILTVDQHRLTVSTNPAAEVMFGAGAETLVGTALVRVLPELRLSPDMTTSGETKGLRRDGVRFPVEWSVGRIRQDNGLRYVLVLRDVSERNRREQALRAAQRLESVGTLASGIAHDFNNLLMGLLGSVLAIERQLDPAHPAGEGLGRMRRAIERGTSLTRQLVQFADPRSDQAGACVALDEAVRGTVGLLQSLVGETIHLAVETAVPGGHIAASAGEVQQILLNLAANARDAMPQGGTLTIRTMDGEPNQAVLQVSDTGMGMDAATRARIFEPFFTTKPLGQGSGLGLSMVFGIVRRLGGEVHVDSEPACGTTFALTLPLVPAPAVEQAAERLPAPSRPTTVLVVDDDAAVAAAAVAQLETLGYTALTAGDGASAQAVLAAHAVDLLLTDVVMPGQSGRMLAEVLVKQQGGLRVLYMSAHPRWELERRGLIPPEAALVTKPFSARELGQALASLGALASPEAPAETPHVLVVEDDPALAESLCEVLEILGATVATAGTAAEAFAAVQTKPPTLVLCDLHLDSGESGYDVARALRSQAPMQHVLLLAVTGAAGETVRREAMAAGFDQVLIKPIDFDQIRALLQTRRVAPGSSGAAS